MWGSVGSDLTEPSFQDSVESSPAREATNDNNRPWEKAADCERSLKAAIDPSRQAILGRLRDLWIALGNEQSFMTEADIAESVQSINRLHVGMIAVARA
jgi:hypothetical protein